MRRYAMVSGVLFSLVCGVQLLRFVMRWPVNVAGVEIPLWASGAAAVVAGTFAGWAFRSRADV